MLFKFFHRHFILSRKILKIIKVKIKIIFVSKDNITKAILIVAKFFKQMIVYLDSRQ